MSQLKIFSLDQCKELGEFIGSTLQNVLYDAGVEGQEPQSAMFVFSKDKEESTAQKEQKGGSRTMNQIERFIEWIEELGRKDARLDYWLTHEELMSERMVRDPWYGITTAINRHCQARWAVTFAFAVVWLAAITFYLVTR